MPNSDPIFDRYADVLDDPADAALFDLARDLDAVLGYRHVTPPVMVSPQSLSGRGGFQTRPCERVDSRLRLRRWFSVARARRSMEGNPGSHGHHPALELAGLAVTLIVVLGLVLSWRALAPGQSSGNPAGSVGPNQWQTPLLVSAGEKVTDARLAALDPATLAPLPGHAPMSLGFPTLIALSPDGRTLALVSMESQSAQHGTLRLIDLASWDELSPAPTITTPVSGLTFNPDSKTLYWLQAGPTGRTPSYTVERYDLDGKRVVRLAALPAGFAASEIHPLDDGMHIAVLGGQVDALIGAEPSLRVVTLDATTGQMVADLQIHNVGIAVQETRGNNTYQTGTGMIMPGLGWDVRTGTLYVVHSDANTVTAVDLVKGNARSVEFAPLSSLAAQQVLWPAANPAATIFRQAALSPDGAQLYVYSRLFALQAGEFGQTPLGLSVIRTSDLTEARHLDLAPNSYLMGSPDGSRILRVTMSAGSTVVAAAATPEAGADDRVAPTPAETPIAPAQQNQPPGPTRIDVLDPTSLEWVGDIELDPGCDFRGFSADSRYTYCWRSGVFTAIDLDTHRVVAQRSQPESPHVLTDRSRVGGL